MTLGEMKELFLKSNQEILDYGVSEPFSWRGSYDEVAFRIERNVSKKECLDRIFKALNDKFYGYKGGEFYFNEHTPVNFESSSDSYSDGEYREEIITEVEGCGGSDRDLYLTKLMVN